MQTFIFLTTHSVSTRNVSSVTLKSPQNTAAAHQDPNQVSVQTDDRCDAAHELTNTEDLTRFDADPKKQITKRKGEKSKRMEWTVVDNQDHYIGSKKEAAKTRRKLAWRKGKAMIDNSRDAVTDTCLVCSEAEAVKLHMDRFTLTTESRSWRPRRRALSSAAGSRSSSP